MSSSFDDGRAAGGEYADGENVTRALRGPDVGERTSSPSSEEFDAEGRGRRKIPFKGWTLLATVSASWRSTSFDAGGRGGRRIPLKGWPRAPVTF